MFVVKATKISCNSVPSSVLSYCQANWVEKHFGRPCFPGRGAGRVCPSFGSSLSWPPWHSCRAL